MPSDFAKREVAKEYGVLIESAGVATRATFVVGTDDKIVPIEEGTTALDPSGAELPLAGWLINNNSSDRHLR